MYDCLYPPGLTADTPLGENLARSAPTNTFCAGSSMDCITAPAPPAVTSTSGSGVVCPTDGKRSLYSSCGKLGKVGFVISKYRNYCCIN